MKEKEVERQVHKAKKENAHQNLPVVVVLLPGWLLHQKHSLPNIPEGSISLSPLPHHDLKHEGEVNKIF